jgi:hypothetical protein
MISLNSEIFKQKKIEWLHVLMPIYRNVNVHMMALSEGKVVNRIECVGGQLSKLNK